MNKAALYVLLFTGSSAVSFATLEFFPNTAQPTQVEQRGVQQTDPMQIERLAALVTADNLTQVSVPKAVVKRSVKKLAKAKASDNKIAKPVIVAPVKSLPNADDQQPIANDEVSKELLAKFNKALLDTENTVVAEPEVIDSESAVAIYDLPQRLLARVPDIRYSSHVYSSTSANRSVRLNDRDLREGSWLTEDIEILEILQNEVIMRVGPQSFSLKALSDWSG